MTTIKLSHVVVAGAHVLAMGGTATASLVPGRFAVDKLEHVPQV
jgi:hypothetical protein